MFESREGATNAFACRPSSLNPKRRESRLRAWPGDARRGQTDGIGVSRVGIEPTTAN